MTNLEQQYPETLWDIRPLAGGTVLRDYLEDGVRVLLLRSTGSICVYLGVPLTHPLAGFSYDDIPLDCHGGLAFSKEGDGRRWPQGFWWYGYDYSHAGDQPLFEGEAAQIVGLHDDDHRWTIKEVCQEAVESVYGLKQLMKLAEQLAGKR